MANPNNDNNNNNLQFSENNVNMVSFKENSQDIRARGLDNSRYKWSFLNGFSAGF